MTKKRTIIAFNTPRSTIPNPTLTEVLHYWENVDVELLTRIAKMRAINGFYSPLENNKDGS